VGEQVLERHWLRERGRNLEAREIPIHVVAEPIAAAIGQLHDGGGRENLAD